MPPRRKKQPTETNQSQETKEFTEARNKILSITPENLALFQNSPNHSLDHISGDPYAADVLHLVNAVDLFNDITPLVSTCPFHSQEDIRQFIDGVHSLYELGNSIKKENMTCINYVNEFKPIWDSIRNFAVHIDINLFHEMFSTSRSTISSVLRHVVQMAHEDPRSNPIIFERFKSVAATRKRLATRLSVLMHGRKIRTVITLWDKLIETQGEVIQFFKTTGLMTAEMMSTVNNCFTLMFDSALHLKNLLVIQQLASMVDRCLARPLKYPVPMIYEEEEEIPDDQSAPSDKIGREITDELILTVHGTTDFLKVYKNFIEEVKPTIDKGQFLTMFKTFLEKSQCFDHFDLYPTLFSMFYKFRKLEIASLPLMVTSENDPNSKEIKSVYRNIQLLLHNAKTLSGEEIDAESSLELLYPIIDKIRQESTEVNNPSYQSLIQSILSSLDSICEELQTIDDTICVSFQVDQLISKIASIFPEANLTPYNFHCLFYYPPSVSEYYEPDNFQAPVQSTSKNFEPLIEKFVNELKKFQINFEIEKTDSHIKVNIPDLSEYFSILLSNYRYSPIQNLLVSPPSETVFFTQIFEMQKEMLVNDINDDKLDLALTAISNVYYFLLLLDYAGYVNFSNSLHLICLKSYSKINFQDDDQIGPLLQDLNSVFDCTQIKNPEELTKSLIVTSEQNKIDQKLSHMRLFVYTYIETLCHLSPELLSKNFDTLSEIIGQFTHIITKITDTISSDEFYGLLCRMKETNIPEINEFISNCVALHDELKKYWNVIPIQTNLMSYLHVDYPDFSYKKAVIYDLVDFLKLCLDFRIIYCDLSYLENIVSMPKWPRNMLPICRDFLKTVVISHDVLFKMLTIASSNLSNCSKINETVDLINRGKFSCQMVKTLLTDLITIRANELAAPDKIDFMCKYALQLTAFLMLLNTIEILFPSFATSIGKILNRRNFLLSYCNSVIYLTNIMDVPSELSGSIFDLCLDLKKLLSMSTQKVDFSNDDYKDLYNFYFELRLKFSSVSPDSLTNSAKLLIESIDDNELSEKFEAVLKTIDFSSIPETQENIDSLLEVMKKRFDSNRDEELYEISMKIYDLLSSLILYYSRINDEDAFFIFSSTNKFYVDLKSPPILSPFTPVSPPSPLLPHQHMFNSTNKGFKKFCKKVLDEKVKDSINCQSDLLSTSNDSLLPPPFVLSLDAQQNLMDVFMREKEKHESNSSLINFKQKKNEEEAVVNNDENNNNNSDSVSDVQTEILMIEVKKLEDESQRLLKTIDVLNETTKNLYDEFVNSQTNQFGQYDKMQAQTLNDVRTNKRREIELASLTQSASNELKKKTNVLNQLNEENESLRMSNLYLAEEIIKRRSLKRIFESQLNSDQRRKTFPNSNLNAGSNNSDIINISNDNNNKDSKDIDDDDIDDDSVTSVVSSVNASVQSANDNSNKISSVPNIPSISSVDDLLMASNDQSNSLIFNDESYIPESLASICDPMCCAMRKDDSDMIKWTVGQWKNFESPVNNIENGNNNNES